MFHEVLLGLRITLQGKARHHRSVGLLGETAASPVTKDFHQFQQQPAPLFGRQLLLVQALQIRDFEIQHVRLGVESGPEIDRRARQSAEGPVEVGAIRVAGSSPGPGQSSSWQWPSPTRAWTRVGPLATSRAKAKPVCSVRTAWSYFPSADLQPRLGRQHSPVGPCLLQLGENHFDDVAFVDRQFPVARLEAGRVFHVGKERGICTRTLGLVTQLLFARVAQGEFHPLLDLFPYAPSLVKLHEEVRPFCGNPVPPDRRIARPAFGEGREELVLERRPRFWLPDGGRSARSARNQASPPSQAALLKAY